MEVLVLENEQFWTTITIPYNPTTAINCTILINNVINDYLLKLYNGSLNFETFKLFPNHSWAIWVMFLRYLQF